MIHELTEEEKAQLTQKIVKKSISRKIAIDGGMEGLHVIRPDQAQINEWRELHACDSIIALQLGDDKFIYCKPPTRSDIMEGYSDARYSANLGVAMHVLLLCKLGGDLELLSVDETVNYKVEEDYLLTAAYMFNEFVAVRMERLGERLN